ncbi:MAG: sulfotransferase [Thermoanaerobaculia bacterium]|jgi:hypothetical protein
MIGTKVETAVVVLSTGRTGTMALAEYFDAAYPQVRALHEPKPSRHLRLVANRYLCGKLTKDETARRLVDSRRDLLGGISQPVYIESNPFLLGCLDVLGELFPNVKVVHVVRDPRTYIRSSINFRSRNLAKWLALRLVPYWVVTPERYEERTVRTRAQMSEIEWLAWNWALRNAFLDRGERLYGENYLRLRFEDVFDSGGAGLRSMARWIGLPDQPMLVKAMREKKVNPSKRSRLPEWESWPAAARESVRRHCGELAGQYGYALSAEPQPPT